MTEDEYFKEPEGIAEREIRALYSELTNCLVFYIDEGTHKQECFGVTQKIIAYPRYHDCSGQELKGRLENDLYSIAHWWGEYWRYNECWPVLESLLDEKPEMLGKG